MIMYDIAYIYMGMMQWCIKSFTINDPRGGIRPFNEIGKVYTKYTAVYPPLQLWLWLLDYRFCDERFKHLSGIKNSRNFDKTELQAYYGQPQSFGQIFGNLIWWHLSASDLTVCGVFLVGQPKNKAYTARAL